MQKSLLTKVAQHCRNTTDRLAIIWSYTIPCTPHILPALVSDSVKPRCLKVVRFRFCPAIAHVRHELSGRKKFKASDIRNARIVKVSPSHRCEIATERDAVVAGGDVRAGEYAKE